MAVRSALKFVMIPLLLGAVALALIAYARRAPQDMPWTALDLAQPIGLFTGRKLAALADDAPRCRALLDRAGITYAWLPPRGRAQCGYSHAVRLNTDGALGIGWQPADLGISCPVAAALAVWEWEVVQPAALAHLGSRVTRIEHYGSYSCRRIYGRGEGAAWSEHATANAVDIAAFRLVDGSRVTVHRDWNGTPGQAAFLRAVRDGACRLFATTLSPDYNAVHADHLHLDQAARGQAGWRACR
jgi:hypothetical protein